MTREFLVPNIIACIAAVLSFLSAIYTRMAARETQRAAEGQLVNALLESYSSSPMLSYILLTRKWVTTSGADEFRKLRQENYHSVRDVDEGRRIVAHFFQRVYTLHASGFLTERAVRAIVTKGQAELFAEIIEPLEAAIGADYDRSSFDFFRNLYGIPRTPAPIANPR
jgi:hypothetical protein